MIYYNDDYSYTYTYNLNLHDIKKEIKRVVEINFHLLCRIFVWWRRGVLVYKILLDFVLFYLHDLVNEHNVIC
jgi:hypothetical protein